MTIVLALLAAAGYGLGDFVGGVGAKRATPYAVALLMSLVGAVLVGGYALVAGGSPTGADLAWAVAGGAANGFGSAFLYRGLAHGRMGVVAPVSAVGAASLPVLVGVALGERPALLVWLGILVGLPGIWLVSREPEDGPVARSGFVDGVLAGLGFGGMFVALAQVPARAGLVPVALNELVAAGAVVLVALGMGVDWRPTRSAWAPGAVTGVLAAGATVSFLLASQRGYLAVAALVTSLYPALTVLLAATVLREPLHRGQVAGLGLCLAALALISLPS